MRSAILILFLIGGFYQTKAVMPLKGFERQAYYKVLKSGTVDIIDEEIAAVQSSGISGKDAFEGTLLMKKAGMMSKPKDKLELFKKGRIKLETAISNDNTNTEYRFMRLIIQEHAPKILKYRSDIEKDAALIHGSFKKLSPEVQSAVMDYRKQSNTLKKFNF